MNCDEAYIKGYTKGDGSLYSYDHLFTLDKKPKILKGYEVCWGDKDIEQLNIVSEIIKKKFPDITPKIYRRKNTKGIVLKCYRKKVFTYIRDIINIDINNESRENIASFIQGFCDAESDVCKTSNGVHNGKKYYQVRVTITQKDRNFLLNIKSLLENKFGIKSYICKKWNQNVYMLRIANNKRINLFLKEIGFRNPTKYNKLLSVQSSLNHDPWRSEGSISENKLR